jgi:serine/threonine-protein kinase
VAANAPSVPLPQVGDRIESFELEEAIGAGGMGAVFRALDTRLDRHVALKILPPEQADDAEVVQRFYQEGRAAARLDHENIARVYTIDHDAKYHFIAFEYIEGTTIRQRVERNGPLPVGEAINFTLQIAGALVHAAERGVVHRDIKPSNIIVTPHGRAKLVDMGLARRFERGGDDGLTQSGMTLGTFDYISPEQARDPRDVDVRSDLYSLGCTLFHMLTGRPPFPEGTVLQKLLQHQEDPPPDVRTLNPEVPGDLANILVKLMAKDRDRRYQTPEQLVRDLLTVAGALGLRSVSPEGLVWMAASHPPGWERHLVWALPAAALACVVAWVVWAGQDPVVPRAHPDPDFAKAPISPATLPNRRAEPVRESGTVGPPESTPAAPVQAATQVVREISVESSEDLLAILADAPPRSVIVLTDDGSYYLRNRSVPRTPARLIDRDLTIKAAAGVRPVLRMDRDAEDEGPARSALLAASGGRLTLEGLEFSLDPGDRDEPLDAIQTENTELTVRRCLFRRPVSRGRHGRLTALHVKSSAKSDLPPQVTAFACHFDGGQVGVLAQGPADVVLRDCTMGGAEPAVWLDNGKARGTVPADLVLRHNSLLAGDGPLFRFDGTAARVRIDDSVIAPARDGTVTLVATDDPDRLDWRGRQNLYGKVRTFLQPTGTQSSGKAIDSWAQWEEERDSLRESGSALAASRVWQDADPTQALTRDEPNPTRAFQLAASIPGRVDVGAREGPFGVLTPPVKVAANVSAPRREPTTTASPTPGVASNAARETASKPESTTIPPAETGAPKTTVVDNEMPEMPVMPPKVTDTAAGSGNATDTEPTAGRAKEPTTQAAAPTASEPAATPAILRTEDQFRNALNQPDARGGTLRIAADADWTLANVRLRGDGRWVLQAEPGPTRPRIRFRPGPADPKTPTAWSVCLELRSGALQLEGIDIVLSQSDAPRQGRWAAFSIGAGADLSLNNCSVTVEGNEPNSAAVVATAGGNEEEGKPVVDERPAAVVRTTDSLLRSGSDLFLVTGGRRIDIELSNSVVSTGGALVHALGVPAGQTADPVKLTLGQVTARTAGGLVLLESALGEPELPVADVRARDSILATTAQGAPLFRVDGQETLTALRDRIKWEGHRVAYHQINAYRRDQSAEVGAVPKIYDRQSWTVAAGTKEAAPVHGDVKFLAEWEAARAPWTLRRDDVRLAVDSPAPRAGADLQRIPEPRRDDNPDLP